MSIFSAPPHSSSPSPRERKNGVGSSSIDRKILTKPIIQISNGNPHPVPSPFGKGEGLYYEHKPNGKLHSKFPGILSALSRGYLLLFRQVHLGLVKKLAHKDKFGSQYDRSKQLAKPGAFR